MLTHNDTINTPELRHTFLGIRDLMARYGRGKTVTYELINGPDFPRPVAPGPWRLDHVLAYEDRVAEGTASLPPAPPKRSRASKPVHADEATDPLAPRRRGRQAAV